MKQSKSSMEGQIAIEFLTTYGWALLIIGIVIASVLIFTGSGSASHYVPSQCYIQPGFPCNGAFVSEYTPTQGITYMISFRNDLGQSIEFAVNGIKLMVSNLGTDGKNSYLGQCDPIKAAEDAIIFCKVDIPGTLQPHIGTKIGTTFTLSYSVCRGLTCSGSYLSSGHSIQQLSPASKSFYLLTLKVSPNDGYIYIQGIKYYGSTSVLLQSGHYDIYASPNSKYSFSSWSISGSTVQSTSLQKTTLILKANSILTANLQTT